jgi:hypothetical protein
VKGPREHGNELSGSIKCWEFREVNCVNDVNYNLQRGSSGCYSNVLL